MEPQALETLFKRLKATQEEILVLYDLSEAEMLMLVNLILRLPIKGISAKLASKLLRAAAYFIESTDDIVEDMKGNNG